MSISIGDLFKKGEFWTNLQASLDGLKKKQNKQSKSIRKIEQDNVILAEQVKYLTQENLDLKNRMTVLEERMWSLGSASNNGDLVINQATEDSTNSQNLKGPNKKLNKDASR